MTDTAAERRLRVRYRLLYPMLARMPRGLSYAAAGLKGSLDARGDRGFIESSAAAMRQVFPHWSERRARAAAKVSRQMMAREILDVYWLSRLSQRNAESFVRLHGLEHLEAARSEGRPVILYSGHFSRLIMPAMALGACGIHTSCLTQDIDQAPVPAEEKRFLLFKLERMQRLMGGQMISKGSSYRQLYRALEDQGILIIIIDAPPGRGDARAQVPFLGGRLTISPGALRLAEKSGAAVVPYFALETANGLEGHIQPQIDLSGLGQDQALAAMFAPLEALVREHPEQWWLWHGLPHLWEPAVATP